MTIQPGKKSIITFTILGLLSIYFLFQLKFSFSLEQFFPEGDEDLEFYRSFTESFESDINFLLLAVERKEGVFEKSFLQRFDSLSLSAQKLPHVSNAQSLTNVRYPLKTPFGLTTVPVIHIDEPDRYEKDKERILSDDRFVNTLISEDATALAIVFKTVTNLNLEQSQELIPAVDEMVAKYGFEDYHLVGPPYFQKEMVAMQQREITISAIVSGILVTLIMFLIFRRSWGIFISLCSIGLGMLLFMGLLGAWGRELSAMAALYPVLMIIVGTSDVIHIMSKYIDELRKGFSRKEAIQTTIREIGLATLLTSLTTAIGFATLMTSRIGPIRDFGLNAAIGVVVAYITVIGFTTALLVMFRADQIMRVNDKQSIWHRMMESSYRFTLRHPKFIGFASFLVVLICFWGMSLVTTNYRVESNLPRGEKISEDFKFFEKSFSGFRPLELAIFTQEGYTANSYEVLQEVGKIEDKLMGVPAIRSVASLATVYRSINQMFNNNNPDAYQLPKDERQFAKYKRLVSKMPANTSAVMVSKDQKNTRITSRILDVGADSVKRVEQEINEWVAANINPDIIDVKVTGTGLILDKNAEYVQRNLLQGLGLAIIIISILMALLFRDWRMVIISLVPNVFPLMIAGAMLGFVGIELEAGVAITFAIVFGIAVDDTIHFLSKFKLSLQKGCSIEESLHITFIETGKAICLTSVILFFGFLVMLFSIHPPSVTIGLLISLTLLSALMADLFTTPVLIRWLIREKEEGKEVLKTAQPPTTPSLKTS
ncbi:MAG: MMPL family transporter [Bacteroidota bacterium]